MKEKSLVIKCFFPLTICVLIVNLLLSGCGVSGGDNEEVVVEEEALIEVVDEEVEESTAPILTDGTQRWRLEATTFGEEEIESWDRVYKAVEGYVFLQAEFEKLSEIELIDAWFVKIEGKESILAEIYIIQGIKDVEVTDSHGKIYPVVIMKGSKIIFMVYPDDEHDFTLYFLDCTTIELGY